MPEKATTPARFLSLTATARRLGLSPSTLCRLRRKHRLFAPALTGLPDGSGGHLCGLTRFHVRQVELIEAALAGALALDDALAEWAVTRARLALPNGGGTP